MDISRNLEALRTVMDEYREIVGDVTAETWLAMPKNAMIEDNGSVGLATYEYPGVYTVHWFFKVRGRQALDLAKEMLSVLFEKTDAKTVRGLTRVDLRGARWACRQIGMTSYGILPINDKDYELFCITKEQLNG